MIALVMALLLHSHGVEEAAQLNSQIAACTSMGYREGSGVSGFLEAATLDPDPVVQGQNAGLMRVRVDQRARESNREFEALFSSSTPQGALVAVRAARPRYAEMCRSLANNHPELLVGDGTGLQAYWQRIEYDLLSVIAGQSPE